MPQDDVTLMMELAKRKMQEEMPVEMSKAIIRSGGTHSPTAVFETGQENDPNLVTYNPKAVKWFGQPEVEDLLAHELVHVRQGNEMPPRSLGDFLKYAKDRLFGGAVNYSYGQDPYELEAFQTMKDRQLRDQREPWPFMHPFNEGARVKHHDIDLDRKPGPIRLPDVESN